jgi:hypothetical protein
VPVAEPLQALLAAFSASRPGSAMQPVGVSILSGGSDTGAKFVTP